MRLTLALTFLLSVFSSAYSQTPENPWSFDVGVNSVTIKDEDGSKLSLPSLSLSRYVFGNFSLGVNFSENNVEISNKDLYYYSLDGIIKYDISSQRELFGVDINPYIFAGYGASKIGDENFSNTSIGGGLNFELSKNIAINAGITYKTIDENNAYNHLQHVVGVKFNFGKGDSDGDGVCESDEVFGCLDSNAFNYDPNACFDDNSCVSINLGCTEIECGEKCKNGNYLEVEAGMSNLLKTFSCDDSFIQTALDRKALSSFGMRVLGLPDYDGASDSSSLAYLLVTNNNYELENQSNNSPEYFIFKLNVSEEDDDAFNDETKINAGDVGSHTVYPRAASVDLNPPDGKEEASGSL